MGARPHYVSEEKKREKLEETRMLERVRRFNKEDIHKKNQRLVSPNFLRDQEMKKFRRTEEKRLLAETKKFKRIKEKPNEQEEAMREKIMKKLKQNPKIFALSGISERAEDLYFSLFELVESNAPSSALPPLGEGGEESQLPEA
jgi:hypothetical protein